MSALVDLVPIFSLAIVCNKEEGLERAGACVNLSRIVIVSFSKYRDFSNLEKGFLQV